jgi:hypothetical protein
LKPPTRLRTRTVVSSYDQLKLCCDSGRPIAELPVTASRALACQLRRAGCEYAAAGLNHLSCIRCSRSCPGACGSACTWALGQECGICRKFILTSMRPSSSSLRRRGSVSVRPLRFATLPLVNSRASAYHGAPLETLGVPCRLLGVPWSTLEWPWAGWI